MGKKKPKGRREKAGEADFQDQAGFWRTFQLLLASGIPLLEAIELAGSECRSRAVVDALAEARDKIRQGGAFAEALKGSPKLFPPIVVNLVRIGERAGALDTMCLRIAELFEKGLITGEGKELPPLPAEVKPAKEAPPVVRKVNEIMLGAVEKGASDIHLVPTEEALQVRYRIDGSLHDEEVVEKKLIPAVMSRIKIMASLDIAERRRPQDGKFKMKWADREAIEFRVSILPSIHGETCVLRVLEQPAPASDLDSLGFPKDMEDKLRRAATASHGLVVVSGPTGSGKSTVLYALVKETNPGDHATYSVEDPAEYRLPGVRQIQVNRNAGLTPAAALRSVLRQDPDIIVAEVADPEAVELLLKAALTGHLVLTVMHASTVEEVVRRLGELGAEPWLLSQVLVLVSTQRLVRKLCGECKKETAPPQEQLLRAGFTEEEAGSAKVFGPVGCEKCAGGYRGRMALLEAMPVGERIRNMIAEGASSADIKKAAVEEGMLTLRRYGIEEVIAGRTSLEEVLGVTPEDA